ncbi:MAG: hypothetical protein ACT4QF_17215 [Sporichthyaceae bacterium]
MSIFVRPVRRAAALGAVALLQVPLAGSADASRNPSRATGWTPPVATSTQRADVAAPFVSSWEAEVVRDRLKILPSKVAVVATVEDASPVATVRARFVRGALVHGGEAVNTHGNSWRAEFGLPAADSTGIYEVWIDARDAKGNAADTMVGTLRLP